MSRIPFEVGVIQKEKVLYAREQRMKNALQKVSKEILDVLPEQCLFVGDGGSNELYGVKSAGMGTVFSEMLEIKNVEQRKKINQYADYHVRHINELFDYL